MSMVNARVRLVVPTIALLVVLTSMVVSGASAARIHQPVPEGIGCEEATPGADLVMGTPTAGMDHGDMDTGVGTPVAADDLETDFDRLYIDMMLPHHGSIIAMAGAALPRLEDERLRVVAQRIVDTQAAEQLELRGYREAFYGSADPAPLDPTAMDRMMEAMPGMGSMDDMTFQMDAAAQVAAICAAENADLVFIDLAIPHHEMAIVASEAALTQASNPEIIAFAQRVIDDQSAEIDELTAIRTEIARGTPQARAGLSGRLAA